ncbi:Flavin reductase (DIM6/NTAB) family NADH-FMN oxidoreductase RutF [Vibrio crassostreae]|nr:Flavin reductase (DIM6/NTAB) family NADH-FMN oxidoreductase RutF [Vibrio crassostreae]CAK2091736.1 Flavin reductase (DIM6/NTAB) family NADH-FMN oxidoreductase RutF [Vibrio crassostreae]CAK2129496.1 Flavin reductase (DIM6/NTAB) family NADH-FMN oxidoreductase RutF [Vibrio crassostreae]CAK2342299.1 Flavin reductase (DIM6/NTAB) family NADH-FMN oxidoreductase RutF [Vibrio crassostreae]CAK2966292.1 Flavin reductase (DIM6/NTAB) family NADH-FMN oxidoreductase RutF [Vibrio crassostreae]
MKDMTLSRQDIQTMDQRERARLINSLSGFKSANLIGTCDKQGLENLAVVSSVVHLGSNPPLLGFIVRPAESRRHTLENILETQHFTINSIGADFVQKAHQTSARYPKSISEFNAVGLTPYYDDVLSAPFVLESSLKIGLVLKEQISIESNQTQMLIGEVITIQAPKRAVMPDGYLDLEALDLVTISGLDSYHVTQRLHRLSYAKPDKSLFPLTHEGTPTSWEAFEHNLTHFVR